MKNQADIEGVPNSVDTYRILLHQLAGTSNKAPRQKTAVNVWRRSHTEEIEKEVKLRAQRDNVDRKRLAPVREKVAKEMFERLSLGERDKLSMHAKEDHAAEIKKWKQETTTPPSTSPADRQRCRCLLLHCAAV